MKISKVKLQILTFNYDDNKIVISRNGNRIRSNERGSNSGLNNLTTIGGLDNIMLIIIAGRNFFHGVFVRPIAYETKSNKPVMRNPVIKKKLFSRCF